MRQLQAMIKDNHTQKHLRIYLSLLCEKHKTANTNNKELIVLLFGNIAEVYGTGLLDPLDKPPNLIKTIVWIVEELTTYLKENSSMIHKACAHSLVEIFEHCMPNKDDKLTASLIFYEPLASIISSGCNKMA